MCELMGLSFNRAVSADFSIRNFALRDCDNADGWGLAWYPDRSAAIVKEPVSWRHSDYSRFLERYAGLRSRTYLAHVRHRTTGGPATYADTHPFTREWSGRDYCFAHNGTIDGFATLPLGRFRPLGGTDSEHVFCHLLQLLAERGQPLTDETDWRWLRDVLVALNRQGKLNCLFTDGERLFAYRDAQGWKGLALRKLRFREQPERSLEDAAIGVTMSGDTDDHGCVVATRPLSDHGWHDLPPGGLLVLQDGTLRFSSAAAPP